MQYGNTDDEKKEIEKFEKFKSYYVVWKLKKMAKNVSVDTKV